MRCSSWSSSHCRSWWSRSAASFGGGGDEAARPAPRPRGARAPLPRRDGGERRYAGAAPARAVRGQGRAQAPAGRGHAGGVEPRHAARYPAPRGRDGVGDAGRRQHRHRRAPGQQGRPDHAQFRACPRDRGGGAGGDRRGADRPRPAATLREALRRGRRAGSGRPLRRVQPRGVPPVHAHRRRPTALPHVPLRRRRMERGHDRSGRAMTPPASLRRAARWAALALLLLGAAQGHIAGSMGYATVSLYGGTVRYSLTLGPDALAAAGGQAAPGARPPPRGGYATLADLVARKVAISADGVRCEPVPGTVTPPTPDRANAVVTVDYACPGTLRELVLRDDLSDALGSDYHTLVRVETLGSVQQYTLESDRREARVAVATPTGGGAPEVTAGSGVFAFFRLGIQHILTGVDHLLFVLALALGGGGIGSLFAVVTAFTVAHSITLALAVLDAVSPPAWIVEPV